MIWDNSPQLPHLSRFTGRELELSGARKRLHCNQPMGKIALSVNSKSYEADCCRACGTVIITSEMLSDLETGNYTIMYEINP